jgi:hypothetical protein
LVVASTATAAVAVVGFLAPPAGSTPGKAVSADSDARRAVPRQYQIGTRAIPSPIDRSIVRRNCCLIAAQISGQNEGIGESDRNRRANEPQYQPARSRYQGELMLQIGVVLALAYVAFLAIWIWATRLRTR